MKRHFDIYTDPDPERLGRLARAFDASVVYLYHVVIDETYCRGLFHSRYEVNRITFVCSHPEPETYSEIMAECSRLRAHGLEPGSIGWPILPDGEIAFD